MKTSRKLLYLACFIGLAATAALALAGAGKPSIAPLLVWTAILATLAGAPGLVHRRAWPLALVLIPLGAYLTLRTQVSVPAEVDGLREHFDFYLAAIRSAMNEYAMSRLPLDLGRAHELRPLPALIVYFATALASFAALSLRRPLPAVVIFLVVLGFGFTIDGATRVIWLPLVFIVLVAGLLTLSRSLARERWRARDMAAGSATAVLALLLALFVLGATSVEASQPWQNWRTWDPLGSHSSRLSFDWMLNYPSLLDPEQDARIMVVRSPVASYWRANVLDAFDGQAWRSARPRGNRISAGGANGSYTYAVPTGEVEPVGRVVREVFDTRSLYTDFLFTGGTPKKLTIARRVAVSANSVPALRLAQPLGPKLKYEVTAIVPQAAPADLLDRGRDYPEAVAPYLELPFPAAAAAAGPVSHAQWGVAMSGVAAGQEWLGLYETSASIVKGATDPYAIALAVEQYLRANYKYSLAPPPSSYRSPYAAFLFDTHIGYCQHFAGTMTVLLRFNGIPARVAVGFGTGEWVAKDTYSVSRTDAHSWVEAYFPQVGWIPFDPTPGHRVPSGASSSSSVGFTDPSQNPGAAGATPADVGRQRPEGNRPGSAADTAGAAGSSSAPRGFPAWAAWVLGLAAALAAWPFGRRALRRWGAGRTWSRRTWSRRTWPRRTWPRQPGAGRSDPGARLHVALALIYAELQDYGVRLPASLTLAEVSGFLKERLDLDASPVVDRVEAVLFGGRAPDENDSEAVAVLCLEMRRRLRARAGWARAALAAYGLGSLPASRVALAASLGAAPGSKPA